MWIELDKLVQQILEWSLNTENYCRLTFTEWLPLQMHQLYIQDVDTINKSQILQWAVCSELLTSVLLE